MYPARMVVHPANRGASREPFTYQATLMLSRDGKRRVGLGKSGLEIEPLRPDPPLQLGCFKLVRVGVLEGHLMRRVLYLVGAMLFFSLSATAQGPMGAGTNGSAFPSTRSGPGPRYNYDLTDWQVAVGYQYNRINLLGTPFNTNGYNTSVVRFLRRWVGLEGQVGLGFGNTGSATVPPSLTARSVFAGGGPRLALRGGSRIEPWVHAVVGIDHFRFTQTSGLLGSNTALGWVGGGGIDFRLTPHTAFRAEGDWLGTRFFSLNQRHFQIVSGLVLNF
jgi:hypothetical protein